MSSPIIENIIVHTANITRWVTQPRFRVVQPTEVALGHSTILPLYYFEQEYPGTDSRYDYLRLSYDIIGVHYDFRGHIPTHTSRHQFNISVITGQKRSYEAADIEEAIAGIESYRAGMDDSTGNAVLESMKDLFIYKDKEGRRYVVHENGEEAEFMYLLIGRQVTLLLETEERGRMIRDITDWTAHHYPSQDAVKRVEDIVYTRRLFNQDDVRSVERHFQQVLALMDPIVRSDNGPV